MKNFPVKYQIYNLTEAISAKAVNDVFRIELLKTWKYLIGIAFVSRNGAGVDNYLTISDNFKTIFDKAPVKIFTKSFRDISKNNIFMPVNIPADGNIIDILFQAATVTSAYDIDVIFVLSNEKTEFKEYNFQTKKVSVQSELKQVTDQIPFQNKTNEVVQKWLSIAQNNMERLGFDNNKVVTKSDSILDGLESSVRFKQTNLGNLIANAMKYAAKNADIAIINSGSIRIDDKITGMITLPDIFRILPFGGKIVQTTITGAELEKMLHIGLIKNIGIGGYLQTSGVSFKNNTYMINGKKLSKKTSYKVVLTDFMSSGSEANLEWVKDFKYLDVVVDPNNPKENDIRQLLINYINVLDAKKK